MNFIEALDKFRSDIKMVNVSYWESILERDGEETFQFAGHTHPKMKQVIQLRQFSDEEKEAKIFSYSSDRHDRAIENLISKKINADEFYVELKEMLEVYLNYRSAMQLDDKLYDVKKTHKEMFPNLWKIIVGEYWLNGIKYNKADLDANEAK